MHTLSFMQDEDAGILQLQSYTHNRTRILAGIIVVRFL
jgi:hypothetical protein